MAEFPSFRLADYVLEWTTPEKCGLAAICTACGSHAVSHPSIHACTRDKHLCNAHGWAEVPNNADVSNKLSLDIAREMLIFLKITQSRPWQPRQSGAAALEKAVLHFTKADELTVQQSVHLSEFAQYRHLAGRNDDKLNLDIAVSRSGILLAVLELKTTIRTDRARGAIRNLTSALSQHRGVDIPLAAVVTAEPLPGRLAAVMPRTGDSHAVYHVAKAALTHAVEATPRAVRAEDWPDTQKQVKDFSELFPFLRMATA